MTSELSSRLRRRNTENAYKRKPPTNRENSLRDLRRGTGFTHRFKSSNKGQDRRKRPDETFSRANSQRPGLEAHVRSLRARRIWSSLSPPKAYHAWKSGPIRPVSRGAFFVLTQGGRATSSLPLPPPPLLLLLTIT